MKSLGGALRGGVEQPERLDGVPEQLDAQRPAVERTEDVDDPPAGRERPQVLDQRRRLVPHVGQPAEKRIPVQLLAHADHLAERVQHVRGEHPLVERAPAQHQRREARPLPEMEERPQPLGDDRGIRGQLVPGEHLVARELEHVGLDQGARAAEEEGQVRGQLLGRVLVRRDAHQRSPQLAREPGQHVSPRRALQPGGAHPGPGPELRAHLSQRIGRGGHHLGRGLGQRGVRLGHRGTGAFKTLSFLGQPLLDTAPRRTRSGVGGRGA